MATRISQQREQMESVTENNSTKHALVSKTHLSIIEHVKQNDSYLMIHKE